MKTFKAFYEALVNVGSQKWPLHAKASEGNHIKDFEEPGHSKGDHLIHHDGETYAYTGKSGKHIKTGQPSHEYRADGDKRVWVRKDGHVEGD